MIIDPSAHRVEQDLKAIDFLAGSDAGRWRVISLKFPILDFAISAIDPSGDATEYRFRAELSSFPAQAPMVQIWDEEINLPLPRDRRPQGGERVRITFQHWQSDTVYRPWERMTGPHNNNAAAHPELAWHPDRHLTFIFEDLHGILNSNARAQRRRATA